MPDVRSINLDNPLVLDWAVKHYSSLPGTAIQARAEIESAWFHDVFIARLIDREDFETLTALIGQLPVSRLATFTARFLRHWPEWPDRLAGALVPILAAHAPRELCELVEKYLTRTPPHRLSLERLIQLHFQAQTEGFRNCWAGLVQQLAQQTGAMSAGSLARSLLLPLLLRNARALPPESLGTLFINAWQEEARGHARGHLLTYLFDGLFGDSDFLDLVQARGNKHSTQRLLPLSRFFADSAPLDTLDRWLDEPPGLHEALQALEQAGEQEAACRLLHHLLSDTQVSHQLAETDALQLAVAGCIQGHARNSLATIDLDLSVTTALMAADLKGDRGLPDLLERIAGFPPDQVIDSLTARLNAEGHTYGGVRLAQVMGMLTWVEFVPALIEALMRDKGDFVCEAASEALIRIGESARGALIARWDGLDRTQRIYGLSVIEKVGGGATADFAVERFEALLREDMESACELAMAAPDIRLLDRLHPHLRRHQYQIDRAYATLAALLDRPGEEADQAQQRAMAEKARTDAIMEGMEQGDLSRDALVLELRCPACGETNTYSVPGVIVSGEQAGQLSYLIKDEIPCASCGKDVEFEFTTKAMFAVTAELLLIQAAHDLQQERRPLIHKMNCRIDGKEMPIAEGLAALRQRLRTNPADGKAWFQLSNLLDAIQRPRAAGDALAKAAERAPHVLDVTLSYAQMKSDQGSHFQALDILIRALEHQAEWRIWGNGEAVGQEFADLYNGLRRRLGRLDLPAFHPANLRLRQHAKIGRNDPCPCGSGKKFKKCCGASGASPTQRRET